MIYEYKCLACGDKQEIVKSVSECDTKELCRCGEDLIRVFSSPQLMSIKPEDSYKSLALGKVVSSSKEERKLAKAMGYEEVGNEVQSKHIKKEFKPYPTLGELGIC